MRVGRVLYKGRVGFAVVHDEKIRVLQATADLAGLDDAVKSGGMAALAEVGRRALEGVPVAADDLTFLPPLVRASKIVCLGLNYRDHAAETQFEAPSFPTLFARFNSSLIGHGAPLIRPRQSHQLDFEGELVAVLGKSGRAIPVAGALEYVAAYSVFNDASIRDYQMKTPQWTAGKNFDGTGAFGPWLVTADELPPGARGLRIETRLNEQIVQQASTSDMIFDVANTVALLSDFMTLEAGDVLVMGTPAGIGAMRRPPLFMKDGDVCEVRIEGIGVLRNAVVAAGVVS
jgi:acylpyruvate hydrolase